MRAHAPAVPPPQKMFAVDYDPSGTPAPTFG